MLTTFIPAAAGGWLLAAGGWWLAVGGWWLVAGSWWLAAGGWRLMAGGWWLGWLAAVTGSVQELVCLYLLFWPACV